MMYYGFDWTYILVMIGALLCIFASSHVTSTYNRYARTRSACGMTGECSQPVRLETSV